MTSSFEFEGVPVRVVTAVNPQRDEVGVRIESALIALGRLKIRVAFPYALGTFGPDYQDWTKPEAHQTKLTRRGVSGADFSRTLDATHYVILGLEMSRLARSCKDWHALLELCAIYRTLLGDADGLACVAGVESCRDRRY